MAVSPGQGLLPFLETVSPLSSHLNVEEGGPPSSGSRSSSDRPGESPGRPSCELRRSATLLDGPEAGRLAIGLHAPFGVRVPVLSRNVGRYTIQRDSPCDLIVSHPSVRQTACLHYLRPAATWSYGSTHSGMVSMPNPGASEGELEPESNAGALKRIGHEVPASSDCFETRVLLDCKIVTQVLSVNGGGRIPTSSV